MSQHNLTQGELLEATQQQGALYLERLQQLAAMGPPKDLTRKEKQTWAAFRKSMVIVGKRQREATDQLGFTKKQRKKTTEDVSTQAKGNGEEIRMLKSPELIEELVCLVQEDPVLFEDFSTQLCSQERLLKEEEAVKGLKLALMNVVPMTPQDLEALQVKITAHGIKLNHAKNFSRVPIDGMEVAELSGLFNNWKEDGNTKSESDFLQHICKMLDAMRFALAWSRLSEADQPNAAKRCLVEDMYKHSTRKTHLTVSDRESPDFTSFEQRIKDYLRGANRAMLAYETLGSSVFLCPQLEFRLFYCPRTGADLKFALIQLQTDLQEHVDILKSVENTKQVILKEVLKLVSGSTSRFLVALSDLEAAADRSRFM